MKKILSAFTFIIIFAAAVYADAPIKDFGITLSGSTSVSAGSVLSITITAKSTDNLPKTDYFGHVGIMASVGDVFVMDGSGNTITQVYFDSSGRWSGFLQVLGSALPLTITCKDFVSDAIGTVYKTVTPDVYVKPMLLMPGMTWAPGTIAGYTGWPVTQTTTMPFYVTVMAVDAWNNTINSAFPSVKITTSSNGKSITPTSVNLAVDADANTVFAVTLFPSSDIPQAYNITAKDVFDSSKTDIQSSQSVWFISLNNFFISAIGPASAVAGEDFTVSVIVTHDLPGLPVSNFNGETVKITGVDFGGNTLNPVLTVSPDGGTTTAGVRDFTANYTKSSLTEMVGSGIKIAPSYIGAKNFLNIGNPNGYSGSIIIYAAAPESFTFSADKTKMAPKDNSVLSVKVFDHYLNPVSNTAVDFTVTTGAGELTDSISNSSAVRLTDIYGYAYITVTAQSNTKTTVSAAVAGIASIKEQTLEFALVTRTDVVKNHPNPFNPSQGPTIIEYYLNEDAEVTMSLYSFSGSLAWKKVIPAGSLGGRAGINAYPWDGVSDRNMMIGVGVYTLKIEVKAVKGKYTLTRKIAVKK